MHTYISLFEIPVSDLSRAIRFYEQVLNCSIERMSIPEMEMGILPYENQMVPGLLVQGEGYTPSADGVCIYLNAGDDLEAVLKRVEPNGGQVILPKTAHADESGYFALFFDTEGNKLGLNATA